MVIARFEKCISCVHNNIRRFRLCLPHVMGEGTVLTYRGLLVKEILPLYITFPEILLLSIKSASYWPNFAADGAEEPLTE